MNETKIMIITAVIGFSIFGYSMYLIFQAVN